ncbi:hypothetical protein Pcinc_026554 [Petrolisthes cinctipes]|uniref:Uncharacterized protein n=1 Tax=Petrolisthes cinctipes TaxID=88211 RepID=A0AAE1F834_PETCI|nr:hypothetical protein Pcinc_026554 [Petrolisthes cinctipes]
MSGRLPQHQSHHHHHHHNHHHHQHHHHNHHHHHRQQPPASTSTSSSPIPPPSSRVLSHPSLQYRLPPASPCSSTTSQPSARPPQQDPWGTTSTPQSHAPSPLHHLQQQQQHQQRHKQKEQQQQQQYLQLSCSPGATRRPKAASECMTPTGSLSCVARHQWQQTKPRSWDNLLTTRGVGGYGFGYGFIDTIPPRGTGRAEKMRSVSTHRLRDDDKENVAVGGGSRTVRPATRSSENLVSPLDGSCFSCDCLSIDPAPLHTCLFSKPKSTESLLAPRSLHPAASDCSLAGETHTPASTRRRSRASSLADCLGASRHSPPDSDQMTHL